MSVLAALIMGLVQGLTEFLPVSSSAHLVFTQHFLHLRLSESDTVSFDVLLHLGTLVAVLVYFRKDVWLLLRGFGCLLVRPRQSWQTDPYSRLSAMLIIGTVPAGIAGKALKPYFEAAFQSVPGTAAFLLVTAVMLFWITRRKVGERTLDTTTWKDALLIGICQAVAILPGVSRLGSTITGGLLRGFDRDAAPRFSFLLSIPIIFAGGLLDLKETLETGIAIPPLQLGVGFVAAAISGYVAVVLLLGIVKRGRLDRFAYYCVIVGVGMLLYWQFLVPKIDVHALKGSTYAAAIGYDAEGKMFGPVHVGERWALQVPMQLGSIPPSEVEFVIGAQHLPTIRQQVVNLAGKAILDVEFEPLHLENIPAGGETREVWVILRNKWGIQNEVEIPLFVMPTSSLRQTA